MNFEQQDVAYFAAHTDVLCAAFEQQDVAYFAACMDAVYAAFELTAEIRTGLLIADADEVSWFYAVAGLPLHVLQPGHESDA